MVLFVQWMGRAQSLGRNQDQGQRASCFFDPLLHPGHHAGQHGRGIHRCLVCAGALLPAVDPVPHQCAATPQEAGQGNGAPGVHPSRDPVAAPVEGDQAAVVLREGVHHRVVLEIVGVQGPHDPCAPDVGPGVRFQEARLLLGARVRQSQVQDGLSELRGQPCRPGLVGGDTGARGERVPERDPRRSGVRRIAGRVAKARVDQDGSGVRDPLGCLELPLPRDDGPGHQPEARLGDDQGSDRPEQADCQCAAPVLHALSLTEDPIGLQSLNK